MNIKDLIDKYINQGYDYADASSKVCQDIILIKIANSKYAQNITIKGGVVIHNISNSIRRATRDLDLDFIKYSLDDESIKSFIENLNKDKTNIKIKIINKIEELHQQDYNGKRVYLEILDEYGNKITTKLDIGVHKNFEIEQDEYCFNIENQNINLLINSKEQIFTEKLKSLLKLGFRSTRYKDLFDFYYLIYITGLDKQKLLTCFNILIFNDNKMKENTIKDIVKRLKLTLNSDIFKNNLNNPKINWLDISINEVINKVLDYLDQI